MDEMTGLNEMAEDGTACPAEALGMGGLPCTNDALRRATRQLAILYDEVFLPTGLKATQLGLMLRIDRLGGVKGPTLQALASGLGIGVSALTHALRPLVRDGMVDLRTDERDRRSKRAVLTTLGRRHLDDGGRLWEKANERVEALLGTEDAGTLRALAERISSDAFVRAFRSDPDKRRQSRGLAGRLPPAEA